MPPCPDNWPWHPTPVTALKGADFTFWRLVTGGMRSIAMMGEDPFVE